MKNNYIVIGVVIIALVLVGFFVFRDSSEVIPVDDELNGGDNQVEVWAPEAIDAMHQFSEGRHIVAGKIDLPTPCHILREDVSVMESFPEQVVINFTAEIIDGAEMCAQVITPSRFKVEFSASEEASIGATVNGVNVRLNLFDVAGDEDLEDFEIDVKS